MTASMAPIGHAAHTVEPTWELDNCPNLLPVVMHIAGPWPMRYALCVI